MNITLIGAGQLGGSLAMALRAAEGDCVITAYDTMPAHAEYLLARGAVDATAATIEDAVREADIVVLACPLGSYREIGNALAHALDDGTILTDLGSVKQPMDALAAVVKNALVVPAHPIAGSEKAGPQAARGELFENRLCILTPNEGTDPEAMAIIETLWNGMGADVIQMPAAVHDQIYAYVSHLPHFIAFVAASYFHGIGVKLLPEDETFAQFLRISRSGARMWTDIALANREALLPVLATYIALLEHFASELRAGEKSEAGDANFVAKALVPRILAASLISTVSLHEQQSGMNLRPFAAGGMRDIVAPAAVTPEEDTEAISKAAHLVADHLDQLIPQFKQLEQLIGAENAPALYASIEGMVQHAHMLASVRN